MSRLIGYRRCGKKHILGIMRQNGNGVEFLELFRQAIDYGEDMPELVDVIGMFPAGFGIRCSICGDVVDFHLSPRYAGAVQTMGPQEND
jgi:hypothetical protein